MRYALPVTDSRVMNASRHDKVSDAVFLDDQPASYITDRLRRVENQASSQDRMSDLQKAQN